MEEGGNGSWWIRPERGQDWWEPTGLGLVHLNELTKAIELVWGEGAYFRARRTNVQFPQRMQRSPYQGCCIGAVEFI